MYYEFGKIRIKVIWEIEFQILIYIKQYLFVISNLFPRIIPIKHLETIIKVNQVKIDLNFLKMIFNLKFKNLRNHHLTSRDKRACLHHNTNIQRLQMTPEAHIEICQTHLLHDGLQTLIFKKSHGRLLLEKSKG